MTEGTATGPFAPLGEDAEPSSAAPPTPGAWVPQLPAPVEPPEAIAIRHRRHGAATARWVYRDAEGRPLFAVVRFDPKNPDGTPKLRRDGKPKLRRDGKPAKEVLPYTCGTKRGRPDWQFKAAPKPHPLYGLERLAARPNAPVVIVEGEKAADAAAALFPEHVAVTWSGGSNAIGKTDWRPLAGRHVTVWPDNDAPGHKAAAAVEKALVGIASGAVAVVEVPTDWPDGWDVADPLPVGVAADTLAAMLAAAEAEPATAAPGDALRADVARAAAHPQADYLTIRREMARRHGVPVAELDALRTEAMLEADAAEDASPKEAQAGDRRGRPDLFINGADLPDTAAELATRLAELPMLFDRGGPARLAFDAQRNGLVADLLTPNGVVNEAHTICRPCRWVSIGGQLMKRQNVTLPDRVAKLYLDLRGRWGLRPLDGIACAPLLHEDGSILAAEGYDAATRLWCEHVPAVDVPDRPTLHDAAAALLRLRVTFRTFPFKDAATVTAADAVVPVVDISNPPGVDESGFLAGLMTAVCRPSLYLAPGLLMRASQLSGAGTGKGLLVRCICAIAFGRSPRAMTAGGSEEELEKRITAALIGADFALFLDNVNNRALKSDTLASSITERPAYVRPLGSSRTVPLNSAAFVAVTGNGLTVSEDMARRFVTVELDAGTEDPEARPFTGDFLGTVHERRADLLRDVLTIWRWGRQQGDALPTGKALGSFNQWARWCRDPLLALVCCDPAERIAEAKAQDPRRANLAEMFAAWWEHHHDLPTAVKLLHEDVRALADPDGRGRQYLANKVRGLVGTRVADFVLVLHPTEGKWSADLYSLRQTAGGAGPENHRGHRGHRGEDAENRHSAGPYDTPMPPPMPPHDKASQTGGKAGADPYDPYDPYASAPDTSGGGVGRDDEVVL